MRGIEFTTDIPEDPNDHPTMVRWSAFNPHVKVEDGFAKIPIVVLRNTQV